MRILGIDPGTNIIGWAILEKNNNKIYLVNFSSIIIEKKYFLIDKLEIIFDKIQEIIKFYKPDEAAIEELFFVQNITTGISVSHARGVILLALKKANVKIFEYKPMEIKKAITGYGRSDKKQVQLMIKNIFNLKEIPKPDDTADAIGIALCHKNCRKWKNISFLL